MKNMKNTNNNNNIDIILDFKSIDKKIIMANIIEEIKVNYIKIKMMGLLYLDNNK